MSRNLNCIGNVTAIALFLLLWASPATAQVARDFGGVANVAAVEPPVAEGVDSEAAVQAETQSAPTPFVVPQMPPSSEVLMSTKFYQAINDVHANNFTGAAQKLRAVRGLAQKQGFSGLPDYSVELIRQARVMLDENREQAAKFLVAQAIELSPEHPRVNFLASSFPGLIGVGSALSAFGSAVGSLTDYPVLLGAVLLNIFLLGLVATTAALMIMCVIQLLRSGELVMVELAKPFPKAFRGIVGAIALPVVLIVPLFGGILGALAGWSFVLSYVKRGCRRLLLLCGVLVLVWGWGIPRMSNMGFNAETELYHVLEDINNGGYSPAGEELLFDELRRRPDDPQLLFAAAHALHRKGLEFAASGLYQEVQSLTSERAGLHSAAGLNLGALLYRDRRLEEAKAVLEQLESRGVESFELFYDLALIHLALLDTAKHREYYNKARDYNRSKLDALVVGEQEEARVLLGKLSSGELLPLILEEPFLIDPQTEFQLQASQQKLAAALMRGGSVRNLLLFGGMIVVLSFFLQSRWSKGRRKRATISFNRILEPARSSLLWCALPAGMSLAGNNPMRGLWLLALVLGLVMAGFEAPMRLFQVLPVEVSFSMTIFAIALLLMLGSIAWSVSHRKDFEEIK